MMIGFIIYVIGFVLTAGFFGAFGDPDGAGHSLIFLVITIIWPLTVPFLIFAGIGTIIKEW